MDEGCSGKGASMSVAGKRKRTRLERHSNTASFQCLLLKLSGPLKADRPLYLQICDRHPFLSPEFAQGKSEGSVFHCRCSGSSSPFIITNQTHRSECTAYHPVTPTLALVLTFTTQRYYRGPW